jgi:hypothetical protein
MSDGSQGGLGSRVAAFVSSAQADIAELDAGRIGRDRSRIVAVVLGVFVVSVGVGVLFLFFSPVVTRDWEKLNAQILDLLKSIVLPLVTLVFGYYFGKADK